MLCSQLFDLDAGTDYADLGSDETLYPDDMSADQRKQLLGANPKPGLEEQRRHAHMIALNAGRMGLTLPVPTAVHVALHNLSCFRQNPDGQGGIELSGEIRGLKSVKDESGRYHVMMYGSYRPFPFEIDGSLRCRLTGLNTFYDAGSGIGQLPLQAAATTGARSIGVEFDQARHEMAGTLLAAYKEVMADYGIGAGIFGSIDALVTYVQGNILCQSDVMCHSHVMFFNNANEWFSKGSTDVNEGFADMVRACPVGTQVLCMDHLKMAEPYCVFEVFQSQPNSTSWNSEPQKMLAYTKVSLSWHCASCHRANNGLPDKSCCWCGVKVRAARSGEAKRLKIIEIKP